MNCQRGPRHDPGRQQFWSSCVARWRRSGLSVREFCRREALSEPSFYAWRRILTQRQASAVSGGTRSVAARRPPRRLVSTGDQFVPLQVVRPAATASTAIEILLPAGRRLRVRPGFDQPTLEAVLDLLERRSC